MEGYRYSDTSEANFKGVHYHLVQVARRALELTPYDIRIINGTRTLEEQRALVSAGKSKTLNSRHLTGHAIDFVAFDEQGRITWEFKYYTAVAKAFKQAAKELGVPIKWGGSWKNFKDGGHIQLTWKDYPLNKGVKTTTTKPKVVAATIPALATAPEVMKYVFSASDHLDSIGEYGKVIAAGLIFVAVGYLIYDQISKREKFGA